MVERVPDRGTFCILAFLALWLFTSGSVAAVAISNPPLGQQTGQRSILNSVGTARLPEAPDSAKRPFRIAAYFRFRDEEREDVVQHVRETIVPTITSLLGRWIRVRSQPSCSPASINEPGIATCVYYSCGIWRILWRCRHSVAFSE